MKPEDVPAELAEIGGRALFEHVAALPFAATPTYIGRARAVLAAVLPEHEKQVRAQVAQEIKRVADEEDDGSSWGGGMDRAESIARGGS